MVKFEGLGLKKLGSISFGLVASLFLLWTLFNSSSFVPEGQELKYTLAFLGYGVLGVYVFGRQNLRTKLSDISFIYSLPFLLVSTFLSFLFFTFLLNLSDPLPSAFLYGLAGIPVYIQLSNSLIFSVVETSFWQGHLDQKIGILGSMITAGFFHMFIWNGSLFVNFIGASLLFGMFSLVNVSSRRLLKSNGFSSSRAVVLSLILTIGFHAGYNMAKFGVLFS